MYVCDKFQFIYMPPQKTGSTSISQIILEMGAYIYRSWEHPLEKWHDGYLKHLNHKPKVLSHYFVFASIRNPYTRAASLYEERKLQNEINNLPTLPAFRPYLENRVADKDSMCHQLNQFDKYSPPEGCVPFKIDALVRLEQLESDLRKIPLFKDVSVPHLRKSESQIHKYDSYMASLILKHKRQDFDAFGYPLDPPESVMLKIL